MPTIVSHRRNPFRWFCNGCKPPCTKRSARLVRATRPSDLIRSGENSLMFSRAQSAARRRRNKFKWNWHICTSFLLSDRADTRDLLFSLLFLHVNACAAIICVLCNRPSVTECVRDFFVCLSIWLDRLYAVFSCHILLFRKMCACHGAATTALTHLWLWRIHFCQREKMTQNTMEKVERRH